MMNAADTHRLIRALEKDKIKAADEFAAEQGRITREIYTLRKSLELNACGLDTDLIERARKIIEVRGNISEAGREKDSVIDDAIAFFLDDAKQYKDLRNVYFGTKSYDRWNGQRSDHQYGWGPAHGYIIFSIGLNPEYRSTEDFEEDDIEACVYFLTCLETIQKAEAKARSATD